MRGTKAHKYAEIKTEYSFEGPIVDAATRLKKLEGKRPDIDNFDIIDYLLGTIRDAYLVRVNGESMIDRQIYPGDLLLVERSQRARPGDIVIAALNGDTAVKKYVVRDGITYLESANKIFAPIEISPFYQFEIQGIVRHVIRML